MRLFAEAALFAAQAHTKQVRKYSGEPYIQHPLEVASIVAGVDECTEQMLAAAVLHDVIEDCGVQFAQLEYLFGYSVAILVRWLTDEPNPDLNRAARKKETILRFQDAPQEAQTIKVADLIANTASIVDHDPDFAKVYLAEKVALLDVMTLADFSLRTRAYRQLVTAYEKLAIPHPTLV